MCLYAEICINHVVVASCTMKHYAATKNVKECTHLQ